MAVSDVKYCFEDSVYRKILYSPLKKLGFVPEKETEIFVSAIPNFVTVYDVARFFEKVGELYQVKLLVEPDGIHNRGYAFITYMNAKLAQKAMDELQRKPFLGNNCLNLQKSVNNCRIFVGGLPTSKTKDEIWQEIIATYNISNIVDVITYRNYSNPAHNRGFVFLEFRTHEEASYFRAKYSGKLCLFEKPLLVDWSVPILETNENLMAQVKIIFLRNLDVTLPSEAFASRIYKLINRNVVEKVYKFKNYAYVHMNSRQNAEKLMDILKGFYSDTEVEVTWAKPPNKFSERSFRDKALINRTSKSSMGSTSSTEASRSPSPLLHRSHSLSISDNMTRTNRHVLSNFLSHRSPASSFAPGTRPAEMSSSNTFLDDGCGPSTSSVINNQNQVISSGNFVVPILPRNLTPFHEIQTFYSPQPFGMPSSRSASRANTLPSSYPTSSNTEIRVQDLEAIVSSLLTDS